jgi:hypothetical protein
MPYVSDWPSLHCIFRVDDKNCGRNRDSQNYDPVFQFAETISNSSINELVLGIKVDLSNSKTAENLPVCIREKNNAWSFGSWSL